MASSTPAPVSTESQAQVTPSPSPSPSAGGGRVAAPPGSLEGIALELQPVADLEEPIATAVAGDGTLLIAERAGRVVAVRDGGEPEVILDIVDEVSNGGERGLLGIAVSPTGDRLVVSYTDVEGNSAVEDFAVDGTTVDDGSRRTLLAIQQPYANHNGGHVAFGPDGLLYAGFGDGGSGGDPHDNGQRTDTLLGKLLRIDPAGGGTYAIPADNPFADGVAGEPEIYLTGVRNPWRFSFDRATGDLWIADVGQGELEEVTVLPAGTGAGANLGWNRFEGTAPYEGDPPAEHVLPVFEYDHGRGQSITGGYVYRGSAIPALAGVYVYGDFYEGAVRGLSVREGEVDGEGTLGPQVDALASFGEDADGELLVLSLSGSVSRLIASASSVSSSARAVAAMSSTALSNASASSAGGTR